MSHIKTLTGGVSLTGQVSFLRRESPMRKFICLIVAALTTAQGVRADDKAEMKALIEKAVAAQGGKEKLAMIKATTYKSKGKVYTQGDDYDFTSDYAVQLPDKLRLRMEIESNGVKVTIVIVNDGKTAWRKVGKDTTEYSKEGFAEVQEDMYANRVEKLLTVLEDKDIELSPLGEIKVDDKAVVGMRVTHKGHRDVNLYFAKDSGLLVKSERIIKDQMHGGKEYRQEVFYRDYKDFGGIKRATKVDIKRDGEKFVESELSDFENKDMIDPAEFAKP